MRHLIHFLVCFFLINNLFAQDFNNVASSYGSFFKSNDGFLMRRLSGGYNPLVDVNWPYNNQVLSGKAFDGQILYGENGDSRDNASFFQFSIHRILKETQGTLVKPILGVTFSSLETGRSRAIPMLGVALDHKMGQHFISYSIIHKAQIDTFVGRTRELFDNQGLNQNVNFVLKPKDKIVIRSRNMQGSWNDGNNRFISDNSFLYGVSMSEYWFLLGPSLSYWTYKKRVDQYWSPQKFYSYGVQAEIAIPIYQSLSFKSGGVLNSFKEDKAEVGSGYYLKTGLHYGDRNHYLFSLELERNKSQQNNNIWRSESVILSAQVPI
jgi:hypothetical protein